MGGKGRHDVMVRGEQSPAVSHTLGREQPPYQLGNVWGRLGENFMTVPWAASLMEACSFSVSAEITPTCPNRGKGWGKGESEVITSLQKKTSMRALHSLGFPLRCGSNAALCAVWLGWRDETLFVFAQLPQGWQQSSKRP